MTAVPGMPYVLVLSLAREDPMCTLFFTHLADRLPLRIVQYRRDSIARELSGASAVIVIRGLFEFGNVLECIKRLRVPLYYFQDDNFMLIREEPELYGSAYDRYTHDRVRAELQSFAGVLLATPALMDYFKKHRLQDYLRLYPPACAQAEPPIVAGERPLTIAFFGGTHRREPFVRFVYPAVCRLAQRRPVRLVAAGVDARSLPPAVGVEIVSPPYNPSYTIALRRVAELGIDILVHPSGDTVNNIYKNPHVLINALAIGAIPVFSDVAPYSAVANDGVALLCDNSEVAWYEALERLASEPVLRQEIGGRLKQFCRAHFGGDVNAAAIDEIVRRHPAPGAAARVCRAVVGALCIAADELRARVSGRLARPPQ